MKYTFNHSFHWPINPTVPPTAPLAGAAEAAAAQAAHAAHATHFAPHGFGPGGSAYMHHYRGYPFRRFGFFRRFFWFGAGAAVATWYYNHRQRIHSADGNGSDSSHSWRTGWGRDWHDYHHRPLPSPPADIAPVLAASDNKAAQAVESVGALPVAPQQQQQQQQQFNEHRWGWRARREAREAARRAEMTDKTQAQAQVQVLPAAATSTSSSVPTSPVLSKVSEYDEMAKIREAVDRLYSEKMQSVKEVQERANEKAKDYARDKLDQLSVALETLRQSLQKSDDVKPAQDKKLV